METKKRLTRDQKREKAVVDLINQMFIIAGYDVTYNDILGKDKWFLEYLMTVEQSEEWKKWGIAYLRKNLKMNKALAEREMMWTNLQWGLKYSNWEEYNK
jgi:hypothetical protein|tara:strand:+ start:227 stop:526 length:300 start_codon:yes stop_codon:yes gene_type:complete